MEPNEKESLVFGVGQEIRFYELLDIIQDAANDDATRLKALDDALGVLNDSAVAAEWFERWRQVHPGPLFVPREPSDWRREPPVSGRDVVI